MSSGRGLNGVAVTAAVAGLYLIYSGVQDVPLIDGLRDLAQGRAPHGRPPKKTEVFSGAVPGAAGRAAAAGAAGVRGAQIAEAARKYIGAKYVFGAEGPDTFDCSGLVVWVLKHDIGIAVPPNVRRVRDFVRWDGAVTIPRNQCAPGDLVCWDFQHMGIAVSNTEMIDAPMPGKRVGVHKIWGAPAPMIRRVK